MTLDERAALYVQQRWAALTPATKRLCGINDFDRNFLRIMWERNFYRDIANSFEPDDAA